MKIFYALLLSLTGMLFAGEASGFEHIQFGISRGELLEEIMKLGYEPMGGADRLTLSQYRMGDLPVEITFFFNRNDRFYAYEVHTGHLPKSRYHKVLKAAEYMLGVFKRRWGKPDRKAYPNPEDVEPHALFRAWESSKNITTIAIMKRSIDNTYNVSGYVLEKNLVTK